MTMPELFLTASGFGAAAFCGAALSTPIAGWIARRLDVMDHPDQVLKPHARPTPYLGGVAIGAGWLVGTLLFLSGAFRGAGGAALPAGAGASQLLLPILVGGIFMQLLGLLDDLRNLAPKLRLAVSALVVVTVMWLSGAGMQLADVLAATLGLALPSAASAALSLGLGLVIVLGACNSTNLIDGLDGLCAGVIGVSGLFFALLSAWLAGGAGGTAATAALVLAWTTAGAALGFLPFNFKPARIFMGDAGSMFLGYSSGMLMLLMASATDLRFVLAGVLCFGVPILDTTLAIFRRWRSGKPLFVGDRSHFYDQLVQRGFSVRQTALICYALGAAYGLLALTSVALQPWAVALVFAAAVAATIIGVVLAGFTRPETPTRVQI